MSAGSPSWWTGMIALVRGVIAALDRLRVEVVGARIDVGEHRRRAALPDGVRRGDERHRRHDHLVARADARDVERELQRGRAVRGRDGVGGADARRERRLEVAHARTLRDPAGRDRPRATAAPSSPRRNGRAERDLHQDALASERDRAPSARRRARRATTRRAGSGPPRGRPRPRSRAARARAVVSARRRVTLLTARSARARPAGRSPSRAAASRRARAGSSRRRWRR